MESKEEEILVSSMFKKLFFLRRLKNAFLPKMKRKKEEGGPLLLEKIELKKSDLQEVELGREEANKYNKAAEKYFFLLKKEPYLYYKPFNNPSEFSFHLYLMSILIRSLDLNVTDMVMDFGAGTCWLTALLLRCGVRVCPVEVSSSALEIGKKVIGKEPKKQTQLLLGPVLYDGYTLPFRDKSFDAIICYDAFHHVPNKLRLLREMYRVMKEGGRVAMSEPGEYHSQTASSVKESTSYGVLESDVRLLDMEFMSKMAGFKEMSLIPLPLPEKIALKWNDVRLFIEEGNISAFPLQCFKEEIINSHIILIKKGERVFTSRHFNRLLASIEPSQKAIHAQAGSTVGFHCKVKNVGDSLWISEPSARGGYVALGMHLWDENGKELNRDFYRCLLSKDVAPGEEMKVFLEFPAPPDPGKYTLVIDMVSELLTWFQEQGSETAEIALFIY